MTAKFSQARKDAFLQALRETSNQTIAAEAAKVSSSWVQLHRSEDPAFRRAVEEAVAQAKARLGSHPEREPPSGWGFLDGEELVVKGTGGSGGGKRVQIARARLRQWSPRVEERFLAALASTCNVKAACAEVGMTAASAYNHRKRWEGFARRWDEAIEIGYMRIEAGLLEHACNLFSWDGPIGLRPMPEMRVRDAIHLLDMHKHKVKGQGKAPGVRWQKPKSLEDPEIRGRILDALEVIERQRRAELSEEQIALDEAEWARRRGAVSP
jgi:hypothetical protein